MRQQEKRWKLEFEAGRAARGSFRIWRMNFSCEVFTSTKRLAKAVVSIDVADSPKSLASMSTSKSISGKVRGDCEVSDSETANVFK